MAGGKQWHAGMGFPVLLNTVHGGMINSLLVEAYWKERKGADS